MPKTTPDPSDDPKTAKAVVPTPVTPPAAPQTDGPTADATNRADAPAPSAPGRTTERRPGPARRFVVRLLRIVVASAVIGGLAATVYVGWPIIAERYLAPVQTNTTDLGALRARIEALEQQVGEMTAADATVDARLEDHQRLLAMLDAADAAAQDEGRAQVRVLKAMELMSRARLFLFQSNYGLAEQDVRAARDILRPLAGGTAFVDGAAIGVAVDRLERTMAALPDFPVAARDDLDIAWLAMLGQVPPAATAAPTSSPGQTPQPSGSDSAPSASP
jgi:hypothetical protein